MTAELLSTQVARDGGARITFQFREGARVLGPYIEQRPAGANHVAWLQTRLPTLPPDYVAQLATALNQISAGTAASFQRALKDLNVETIELGNVVALRVTQATQTNPENVVTALRTRVDGDQGAGTFNAIAAKLKSLGFDTITLERRVTLTL